jgi:hypothetical protein
MSAAEKMKNEGMGFDEWREAWFDLCRERGHVLKTDAEFGGGVDNFVTDGGYCNGPGCKNCGWSACMHCDPHGKRIPQCTAS